MDNFEDIISNSIKNDKLPFEANPSVEQKIKLEMQKKALNSLPRMNSLFPVSQSFFKGKYTVLKAAATILILLSVLGGVNHITPENSFCLVSDSTQTITSDTTQVLLLRDTLPF